MGARPLETLSVGADANRQALRLATLAQPGPSIDERCGLPSPSPPSVAITLLPLFNKPLAYRQCVKLLALAPMLLAELLSTKTNETSSPRNYKLENGAREGLRSGLRTLKCTASV